MAELNTECCTPAAQEACCEPDAKASCCGEQHTTGCGCAAGARAGVDSRSRRVGRGHPRNGPREIRRGRQVGRRWRVSQARGVESESGRDKNFYGCSPADRAGVFGSALDDEAYREEVPETSVMASLGCGVPTAVADLHPGEVVLDLGSGAGADVLISARRVGPTGRAIGLDMTDEMLELARANATEGGVENVEFVKGYLEDMPLDDETVDVVISNCVINLSGDKPQVIREAARVLRAGGRFAVSDVIADPDMDDQTRADMAAWTGCIAGALTEDRVPRRTRERRLRRDRNHRDASCPRARRRGDHPRSQTFVMTVLGDQLTIRQAQPGDLAERR